MAVFALVGGGVVFVADPDAGRWVFLVMVGLVVLSGIAAFTSVRSAQARNQERVGEAYVSPLGVLINGQLHAWNGMGFTFDGVEWADGEPPVLAFHYSFPSRSGRQRETVRVPVPAGQEPVARGLMGQLEAARRPR